MTIRHAPEGDEQLDFFNAAYADIPIRDQRDTMERPFFSLAKKPRKTPIAYDVGGTVVSVYPVREFGIATIWDADILIWLATQITEARDRGGEPGPKVYFHPHNLLKGIRRPTGGDHYKRLQDALRRLASTYVETNIRIPKGSRKKIVGFHWIEHWDVHEDGEGRPTGMSITLPGWLYEGIIQGGGVLSIHEDYFLLTGGIERWLYRVARKHAGQQEMGWQFTMRQLYEKSGSSARFSDFALDVRRICVADKLPEYSLQMSRNRDGEDIVYMIRRSRLPMDDPRFEMPRSPRRRLGSGISSPAVRLTAQT
ncbi:MAG: replication initiator protein A [Bryobacteraceae bacterium]